MSPSPGRLQGNYTYSETYKDPNPDPFKFHVIRIHNVKQDPITAVMVNYPDATTYEGNKVMVLRMTPNELVKAAKLDPHFYEDGPVMARFEPTEEGWIDAIQYCEAKLAKTTR